MRAVALAILATSLSQAALAADFDPGPLRGTEYSELAAAPIVSWEGPYFGGFGGVSQSNFEFKNAFKDLVGSLSNVRDTVLEAEYAISDRLAAPRGKDARAGAFGGFIGYNSQFENVVLGFELDYTQTRLKGTRSDSISRSAVTSNGYFNEYILSGTATTELEGYGTLRARAGYTSGPFVTGGIALGGIKTSTNVMARIDGHNQTAYNLWLADPASIPIGSIDSYGYTTFNPRNLNGSVIGAGVTGAVSKSTVAVGFTAGAGVDIALTQNIFLRGEYQYAWFDDFNGHKFNVNTIRGGAGVKF